MNRNDQKRNGYNYKREDLMNAIACVRNVDSIEFAKYHNIPKAVASRERFEKMLHNKFTEVFHVNYYGGVSRQFLFRITFKKLQ